MKYEIYETDGQYIAGKKIGVCKAKTTALKKAKLVEDYDHIEKDNKESIFWINDKDGNPIGLIKLIEEKT